MVHTATGHSQVNLHTHFAVCVVLTGWYEVTQKDRNVVHVCEKAIINHVVVYC